MRGESFHTATQHGHRTDFEGVFRTKINEVPDEERAATHSNACKESQDATADAKRATTVTERGVGGTWPPEPETGVASHLLKEVGNSRLVALGAVAEAEEALSAERRDGATALEAHGSVGRGASRRVVGSGL